MTKIGARRRRAVSACAAIVSIAALTGSAAAQTAAQQSAMRAHCRDDFMSHCSGVTPGGKAALSCLQQNVASLSPACHSAVAATMHAPAANAAKATAPARAAVAEPAPAPHESGFVPGGVLIDKACARYMIMHCRGMAFDMGRKVACLVDYINAGHFVGPRCKTVLRMTGHLR
jgi:hypothetical protein